MNYVPYHIHTDDSHLDSCTNYKLYVDKVKELGQKAICFTEHGNNYNWIEKKLYCEQVQFVCQDCGEIINKQVNECPKCHSENLKQTIKPIKYLHGVEIYLTQQLEPKVRDNYHTILIAKNFDGVKEINKLVDLSTRADHVYYKPRITFDEFINISNNVITTSACLASPLNKLRDNKWIDKLCKRYDYLEVQPHINSNEQKEFNKYIYELSKKYNKPLIAATDTHSLNQYKAECRSILQKSKHIEFSNEDEFDLTYKSYDELVEMFRQQNVLPMDVVLEAIENTNRMADSVTNFELDTTFKYPILYDNEEEVFVNRIYRMYHEKLDKGIIQPDPRYEENIQEELRVFKKIGMVGFMLFMSELTCWCWDNDIPIGFCRGSVGGSTIAYLTDITDVNPIIWNTVFSRFANEDRKEIGDIDLDIAPSQRHLVYEHIIEKFGIDKTAYVLAIGTISDKGTIDAIGRALKLPLDEVKEIKTLYSEYTDAIKANTEKINKLNCTKEEPSAEYIECKKNIAKNEKLLDKLKNVTYKELFYYFDGLNGTAISQSMHPAGIVVSPVTLPDNYGTFWSKDGKRILSINMEEIHEVSLVKYDILGLKNIEIINDTCKLSHIPYPKSHTVNWLDKNVWLHIADSPVGIFQFESKFAYDSMKKFGCKCVNDLSLVNAAIRPSGETYRDSLLAHKTNKNPSEIIDKLLENNYGWLTFQEDTIKFLTNICGLSGSDADNVRRAIGRKQKDRLDAALPQILEGYCNMSSRPRKIAEKEAEKFLAIIEDSSNYQFGFNHSTGYSMIGYVCGYLRYYYPKEFITAYLNNANNEDDIKAGTELATQFNIGIHSIKFRHSTAQYSCDNSGIYKGIASIKFLNENVGNNLYSIKDEQFNSFVDILIEMSNLKIDSRQLEILIKLNFFEEFGNEDYLLSINNLFSKYYGKKQIKKEKALEDGLDFELIRGCCQKETPKTFTNINDVLLLNKLIKNLPNNKTPLRTKIAYQIENLGYIDIIDKKFAGYCVAVDLNVDYSPKLKLYALANGNTIPVKISKKIFKENPIKRGDIVKVKQQYKKNKMKKIDGEWVEADEKEWWITEYKIC